MKERIKILSLSFVALAGSLLTSCGKEAFVPVATEQKQTAPGVFTIPPKVDILLVEDDTGAAFQIHDEIVKQFPGFLDSLQNKGWDYHFATIPLTTDRPLDQVIASKYDPNWGSEWLAPYPGATTSTTATVASSVFRTTKNYSGFLKAADLTNALNGTEPAFENIATALQTRIPGTGFLRPDAMLAIFVVSNGEDTSGVSMCTRMGDGLRYPCSERKDTSFYHYRDTFISLKGSASLLKFFAAVPSRGLRYQDMADALNGEKYDISQPLSGMLESLANNLQGEKLNIRTRYLFTDREPDVNTIVVTRYKNGDPALAEIIPQDATNGWTYVGYVQNVYAIDSPVPMNLSSGYAIELHGDARLLGNDSASVAYSGAGSQNNVK